MKTLLILLSFFFLSSQAQTIQFQRTYGGTRDDWANTCTLAKDKGYLIAGSTFGITGGLNISLAKTDSSGNLMWLKYISSAFHDQAFSIYKTYDGGYIIGGSTKTFGAGGFDCLLIRIDSVANILWSKTFGGTSDEMATSVAQTSDSGFAFFGQTRSFGFGTTNSMYLIKTNSNGDTSWTKTLGGTINDFGKSFQQTPDGGFILFGQTQSFGLGNFGNLFVIKTDINGDPIWSKHYGGPDTEQAFSIIQTNDGGYIMAASSYGIGAGSIDMYILKTDKYGDTLWTKTYGGSGYDEARSIQQTIDGGFIITGYTSSFGLGDSDIVLIKIDSIGNQLWAKTYGGSQSEDGKIVLLTNDHGFAIVGTSNSFYSGNLDYYLIKTDSLGNSGCDNQIDISMFAGNTNTSVTTVTPLTTSASNVGNAVFNSSIGNGIQDPCTSSGINEQMSLNRVVHIYPNPFATQTIIQSDNLLLNATLTVDNCFGQTVKEINNITGQTVIFYRDNLPSGLYLLRLIEDNKIFVMKLVVVDN